MIDMSRDSRTYKPCQRVSSAIEKAQIMDWAELVVRGLRRRWIWRPRNCRQVGPRPILAGVADEHPGHNTPPHHRRGHPPRRLEGVRVNADSLVARPVLKKARGRCRIHPQPWNSEGPGPRLGGRHRSTQARPASAPEPPGWVSHGHGKPEPRQGRLTRRLSAGGDEAMERAGRPGRRAGRPSRCHGAPGHQRFRADRQRRVSPTAG
jgi:hypothetical protein